jgi:phosphoribosylaminoimidazole (AIR) synthetase
MELHSDQGRNLESRLIQGVSKTRRTPQHPQSDSMFGALHRNGRGAPTESLLIASEGLGSKMTHLPPC